LRVEVLSNTDSRYSKDTGVTLFTLATPGDPLRYITPRSALPVSALTHSRGPWKRSQSPVDMLERRDTYGQAQVCSKGRQGSSEHFLISVLQNTKTFRFNQSVIFEYKTTILLFSAHNLLVFSNFLVFCCIKHSILPVFSV